jgi:hypothetical protein
MPPCAPEPLYAMTLPSPAPIPPTVMALELMLIPTP